MGQAGQVTKKADVDESSWVSCGLLRSQIYTGHQLFMDAGTGAGLSNVSSHSLGDTRVVSCGMSPQEVKID